MSAVAYTSQEPGVSESVWSIAKPDRRPGWHGDVSAGQALTTHDAGSFLPGRRAAEQAFTVVSNGVAAKWCVIASPES
jgi:hypothetical protein